MYFVTGALFRFEQFAEMLFAEMFFHESLFSIIISELSTRSYFMTTDSTPLQEPKNNMCSSGSSHAILHMATFKGFFFSMQTLT